MSGRVLAACRSCRDSQIGHFRVLPHDLVLLIGWSAAGRSTGISGFLAAAGSGRTGCDRTIWRQETGGRIGGCRLLGAIAGCVTRVAAWFGRKLTGSVCLWLSASQSHGRGRLDHSGMGQTHTIFTANDSNVLTMDMSVTWHVIGKCQRHDVSYLSWSVESSLDPWDGSFGGWWRCWWWCSLFWPLQ